jgi:ribosome recycling factor
MHPLVQKTQVELQKVIEHLSDEYSKLQIGRASAAMVEHLMVEAYGAMQPVKAVASVMVPDGHSLQIQPWDRSMLAAIEKAIRDSDLNLNPSNNGIAVMLNIPPLTEERRRDLVKVVGRIAEESKIAVRNKRHDLIADLKRMEHDKQISEDDQNKAEKDLQEVVDKMNSDIEAQARKKEEIIMTV